MAEFDLNQMMNKRIRSIFLKNKYYQYIYIYIYTGYREYEDMIMGKVLINAAIVGYS